MKREKLLKWFAAFFAAMLVFTFLSKAADSVSVAKVLASAPQNQLISHTVSGTGKIESTKETAVFVQEGIKIAQVHVKAGEAVKKGQPLMTLLESSIQESIDKKKDEIQEASLKISDIQSQKNIDVQKRENSSRWAQQDLDTALGNGDINISNAQNELNIAQQRLAEYRQKKAEAQKQQELDQQSQGSDFGDGGEGQTDFSDGSNLPQEPIISEEDTQEQALADDVRAKTEALNQVIMSRNQEVTTADRAKQEAALPAPQDSTEETLQTQLDNLNEELEKLNVLMQSKGEITAPADGVVKTVSAQTGGQTVQDAAAVLYELTGGLSMTGTITKDDLEYVSAGSSVHLEGNSKTVVENAVVQSVQEDSANPGTYILTVDVPQSGMSVGESVDFTVQKEEGPYACCVPLSALYGQKGQEYVLVLDTRDSVLGEIQVARKVPVTVIEKNETTAALQEGTLSGSQKIITETDREIADGSRVRLQES